MKTTSTLAISWKLIINDTLSGSIWRIISCTHSLTYPPSSLSLSSPTTSSSSTSGWAPRMRTTATGVLFRPVPRPLGHFRLFVLLIVDLTRIQPNIQRTALLPNRLVLLTTLAPPHVLSSAGLPPVYGPGSCPLLLICRTSLSAWCYGACYTCCFMCLCAGVWRRRALQSHTGDGGFSKGETCIVKEALMLAGMHTVSRTGEEAPAAASLPVSSCLNAVVPFSQTPILLSHSAGMFLKKKKNPLGPPLS